MVGKLVHLRGVKLGFLPAAGTARLADCFRFRREATGRRKPGDGQALGARGQACREASLIPLSGKTATGRWERRQTDTAKLPSRLPSLSCSSEIERR
jgi:hypothetical protein